VPVFASVGIFLADAEVDSTTLVRDRGAVEKDTRVAVLTHRLMELDNIAAGNGVRGLGVGTKNSFVLTSA
jgi:hypothetical protein